MIADGKKAFKVVFSAEEFAEMMGCAPCTLLGVTIKTDPFGLEVCMLDATMPVVETGTEVPVVNWFKETILRRSAGEG